MNYALPVAAAGHPQNLTLTLQGYGSSVEPSNVLTLFNVKLRPDSSGVTTELLPTGKVGTGNIQIDKNVVLFETNNSALSFNIANY